MKKTATYPHTLYRQRGVKRSGQGQQIKIAALVGIPIAVIALGAVVMTSYMSIEQPSGYCYARADQHKAAVFLDNSLTHQLSPTQLRDYRTGFAQAYDKAPANALILIFTTAQGERGSLARPEFSMCKPASTPEEQEAIGAPSKTPQNLRHIAEQARAEYFKEVDRVLAVAQDVDRLAGDSPILGQFQAVSRSEEFSGDNRSLTVITDGINNSEIARFCSVKGDMPPFSIFEKQGRYADVKPDPFTGVDVTFLLVEFGKLPAPGMAYCTNDEVRAWWPEYFKANGAASVELTRLRHWAGE